MELKSFREFFNEEFLAVESIRYLDKKVFKPFLRGKYTLTEAELKKWRNAQHIIKEDDEKTWLQNDQEIALIKTYQADPNSQEGRDALNKLVENKIPYVQSKVTKYIMMHPEAASERDDMMQECLIALTNAIEKFDPNKGAIFNGYLNPIIGGMIMNHNNPSRQRSIVNGRADTKGNNVVNVVSIDDKIGGDRGEWADKDQTVGDKIVDDNQRMPWEESAEEESNHVAVLHDWYDLLPEDEKTAMLMYFPTDPDQKRATYEEIGDAIGMSKMGAKKLCDRVIIKLRKMAEQAGFVDAPADRDADNYYGKIVKMANGKKI